MTAVARTLRGSLTDRARAALTVYVERATEPAFCPEARYTALLSSLAAIDGTWQDVLDLIALQEPALTWLNTTTAARIWAWATTDLVPERTAA